MWQTLVDARRDPLDFLIVDLPPETADLQQELFGMIQLAGALVVVTPQGVAHLDGRKVIDMLRSSGIRVIGPARSRRRARRRPREAGLLQRAWRPAGGPPTASSRSASLPRFPLRKATDASDDVDRLSEGDLGDNSALLGV